MKVGYNVEQHSFQNSQRGVFLSLLVLEISGGLPGPFQGMSLSEPSQVRVLIYVPHTPPLKAAAGKAMPS